MLRNIKELSLEELKKVLAGWQEPAFRAVQILSWIYNKGVGDFAQMSNLPPSLRKRLKEGFSFSELKLLKTLKSQDGTQKLLFGLTDHNLIEAAIIPAPGRITGCVSAQAGCKFSCRFCASGIPGFKRNLSCAEILEETIHLKNNTAGRLTHLVFMGIGEPLDNYDNVLKAIRMINAPWGMNIGARRITLSTCGIIPGIKRLAEEGLQIELSVSLHAADNATRTRIMPINKKYPLKELIAACKDYAGKTKRQVTFEYILIKRLNSDLRSAENLIKILRDMKLSKINLIPANPVKELNVEPPERREILSFRDCLVKGGLRVTLRRSRGEDIQAACGQLRLSHEKI